MDDEKMNEEGTSTSDEGNGKLFVLKKWNSVAYWSWDCSTDTCAICRVPVMDNCLRCQAESKKDSLNNKDVTCVVCWGKLLLALFYWKRNLKSGPCINFCCDVNCGLMEKDKNLKQKGYYRRLPQVKQSNRCPLCQQEWSIQRLSS